MCGIIGVYGHAPVVGDLYNGLFAIQHRGQDAAGMCTYDDRFHMKKGFGLVDEVFRQKHMRRLTGNIGIAHVRYPTVGGGTGKDAQPFIVNSPYGIALAHNGNLTNFRELKAELFRKDQRQVNSDCDAEALLNVFADALQKIVYARADRTPTPDDVFAAVKIVYERVLGAYSVVAVIAGVGMVAFRDPFGIRPCIMGERDTPAGTEYCVVSESVVLDLLDFHRTRNLNAGEAIFVDADGALHTSQVVEGTHRPCIFEQVYFARPDSFIDKVSVYKTRYRMGKELADKFRKTGLEIDVVIPVPESSRTAATAMAEELGVRFSEGLVKNRYVGRTFIMPGQDKREENIRRKLNTIKLEFEGKRVLIVDDSIVRGSTSRQIVRLAREAGAEKVYFLSYSSPVKFPCYYGIDMQTKGEFIANRHDLDGIARELGADRVIYQDVDAMVRAAKAGNPEIEAFCAACFTGEYPAGTVSDSERRAIEKERKSVGAGAGSKA